MSIFLFIIYLLIIWGIKKIIECTIVPHSSLRIYAFSMTVLIFQRASNHDRIISAICLFSILMIVC